MQRPSMAQDIRKGRRTEIEFMNGFIVDKGKHARHPHVRPTRSWWDLVRKLERGEIEQSPAHLGG